MGFLPLFSTYMDTKDRIRKIMEDLHMTQQVFADYLQQSPATLSSIFNGRTRPTLNVVDAIKIKIPDISIEWLLYGTGDQYITHSDRDSQGAAEGASASKTSSEGMLDFDTSVAPASTAPPTSPTSYPVGSPASPYYQGVKHTLLDYPHEEVKIIDKAPRKVTEIRVYYDDQTYETFVPAKK